MASRRGWGTEDELERLANDYLKKHASNPYEITEEEWLKAHTFDERRLKRYYEDSTNYNPNLVNNNFRTAPKGWDNKALFTRPITTLDIETDDLGRPITISAIKSIFDKQKGRLETVDTFQRYYKSLDSSLRNTEATHGLTHRLLNKLRKQQGADYAWTYTPRERTSLERFIDSSIVVGHNIQAFDIPHLFGNQHIQNQVVDTLIAARNIWGDNGKNSLDQVFKRIFGKTMEEAGLPHHESMSDTIATAMIFEAMTTSRTDTGSALRTLLKHGNLNLAPLDNMLNSQLINAPYWRQEAEHYIDSKGNTGVGHMKEELDEEELLSSNIGTSMHAEDLKERLRGNIDPDFTGTDDLASYITSLSQTIEHLSSALGVIKESAVDIAGFGSALSIYKRGDYIRTLASAAPSEMNLVAEGLNIPESSQDAMINAAQAIQRSKKFKPSYNELRRYTKLGWGDEAFVKKLRHDLSQNDQWDSSNVEELERDQEEANLHRYEKNFKYAQRRFSRGLLSEKQFDSLDLTSSYEDLTRATDELVKRNTQLLGIYEAISRIKIYSPNQYVDSARSQWSGISKAAGGLLPNFIKNPIDRLASASFNFTDKKLVPYNRFMSAWNSGIGNAFAAGASSIGAAIGTAIAPGIGTIIGAGAGMALKGAVGGVSQIYGNIGQGRMELKGYQIQNNLNTLSAMVDWVSTPFKLLGKVTKTLIANFSGLSLGIKKLMTGGLSDMSSMGNPLTDLTGVNYTAYQGTTALDRFSLLNKGTMNSVYENFAKQQKALYTLGELNTSRVIGASLLGVFPEVYSPTTDAKSTYNTMANKILGLMKTQTEDQRATTMYLASLIDSSLPSILNTARLMGVKDVSSLSRPQDWDVFWHPLSEREERSFRRSQYQFGMAGEQLKNSKMRIADKLWNAVGKDLYNGVNRVVDAVATGDWKAAVSGAVDMWNNFKEKVSGIWQSISKELNGEGDDGIGIITKNISAAFKKLGTSLLIEGLKLIPKVLSVWDTLVLGIVDKMQGLIAYMSTISIEPTFKKGRLGFKVHSIDDATKIDPNERALQYEKSSGTGQTWNVLTPRSKALKEIWDTVYPENKKNKKYTVGDVRNALYTLAESNASDLKLGEEPRSVTISGLGTFAPTSQKQADALMDMVLKRFYDDLGNKYGSDMSAAAAMFGYKGSYYDSFDRGAVYDKTGIFDTVEEGITNIEDTTEKIVQSLIGPLTEKKNNINVELNFKAQGKPAGKMTTDGVSTNVSGDFRALADVLAEGAAFVAARSY